MKKWHWHLQFPKRVKALNKVSVRALFCNVDILIVRQTIPTANHIMQAFFSPLGHPEQSLTFRNALISNPEACHVALNSAIRDATGSPSDRQLFNSGLQAHLDILIPLYIEHTFFGNIDTYGWYPTSSRAKKILQACKEGLYTKGIEGLFMAYGGLRAVVALLACVRGKNYDVVAAIIGISSAQRVAVVEYVKQCRFADSLERWLEEYEAAGM